MTRKNRFRALRNLVLTAVLLFAVWLTAGAPIPHWLRAANMHRKERECLLERSEIVWRHRDTGWGYPDILVGVTPTAVYTYVWGMEVWTRDPDGPTLVPLPSSYASNTASGGGTYGLLAVDPPAGAESARLTVTLETQYHVEDNVALYSEEYQEESARDGECFLFPQLTLHHPDHEDPLWAGEFTLFISWSREYGGGGSFDAPYTLEFFDGEGNLILSCGNQT